MTLYPFTTETYLDPDWVRDNFRKSLTQSGLNLIRQLQDRSVVFTQDGGEFAEAYVDSTGQKNSVTGTNTVFDTDKFSYTASLTLDVSTIVGTNTQGSEEVELKVLFDGSLVSLQSKWVGASDDYQVKIYKNNVEVEDFGTLARVADTIYTYTPSSPINVVAGDVIKIKNETNTQGIGYYDASYTNTNPYFTDSGISYPLTDTADTINAVFTISESTIQHTIPTGIFSATVSSLFGCALVEDWEAGNAIQFKISNATEDSGWIDNKTIGSFTPFTSEPTKLIVKLDPDDATLSINGFALFEHV